MDEARLRLINNHSTLKLEIATLTDTTYSYMMLRRAHVMVCYPIS